MVSLLKELEGNYPENIEVKWGGELWSF
jgi:hypothetical protein